MCDFFLFGGFWVKRFAKAKRSHCSFLLFGIISTLFHVSNAVDGSAKNRSTEMDGLDSLVCYTL